MQPNLTTAMVSLVVCVAAMSRVHADDRDLEALENAKITFQESTAKAKTDLESAIEAMINEKAKAGSLDAVLQLRSAKDEFQSAGTVPSSPLMRSAASNYARSIRTARTQLELAYQKAIVEHTRELAIDKAESLRAELQAFSSGELPNQPVHSSVASQNLVMSYTFYAWEAGQPPVKMLHKNQGFCYLIAISGAFNGGGEHAQITLEPDGHWYLKGVTHQGALFLQAVGVTIKNK